MSRLGFDMVRDESPAPARRNRGALVVVVVGIALVMLAGLLLMRSVFSGNDYSGDGTGSVTVQVTQGQTLSQIADTLAAADVVKSADAFLTATVGDDRAASIAPGTYQLREQMSGAAALTLMLDPASRSASRVVVPEGLTVKETVDVLVKGSHLPAADFAAALARPATLGLPEIAGNRPEGFLFPATYDLTAQTDATALLNAMTRRFEQAATTVDLAGRSVDLGRTPLEVVTVASIVQREVAPGDYAKAARVIYNRLAAGQKLQLDSTVAYALGVRDLHLSAAQLATDSPYNTYLVTGLPPGPIANPGQAALEAALAPAAGDWRYWITVDPKAGVTTFTSSYQEFLALKRQFQAATGG